MSGTRSADRRSLPDAPAGAGRLADCTVYHGRLGELAYDPDEDRVQCHLCGEWFRIVGGSHVHRRHGWTLAEYRDAFRLPMGLPTCSTGVSQRLSTSAVAHEFGKGDHAPINRRRAQVRPWRSLAAQHPELVEELHRSRNGKLDPTVIAAGSARKVWWRCPDCRHAWQATVGSRSAGHGCPRCYGQRSRTQGPRPVSAARSLAALYPAVAAEWDRQRNRGVDPIAISPNSKHKAWWRCAICGHQWAASIQNRSAGHGCPPCACSAARAAGPPSGTSGR